MPKVVLADRASAFCALVLLAANGFGAARADRAELFVKHANLTESSETAGDLDTTFGTGGRQVTDFFGGQDIAFGLALQPEDTIVLAGFASHGSAPSSWDLGLARYSPGLIPPDFSVAFSAASIIATAGSKVHATLTITRKGSFNGTVTVTPPQPLMGIKPKPADRVAVTGSTAVFKMKVGDRVPPGSYDLTFTAADDSAERIP